MQRILITGSSRGIGFALVEEFLKRGATQVFATCRQPDHADALNALMQQYPDALTIVALDINDSGSIAQAVKTVSAQTAALDMLINNAGIFPDEDRSRKPGELGAAQISHVLTTNSVAPVMVTQGFASLLSAGDNPRMAMISSNMGSLEYAASARGSYGYRMSKASMNMAARILANDLSAVTVITMNPGWVQTDMGGNSAAITPQTSASGIAEVIDGLSADDNGKFFKYDGSIEPW